MGSRDRRCGVLLVGVCLAWSQLAATPAAATPAAATPVLRAGDRVVFLGDSITTQQLYTRYIEVFTRLRYPALDVSFTNAGVGGHLARDGMRRLENDVLAFRPTVVFVNFGMNDGHPAVEAAEFEQSITSIFDELARHREIRVIVWLEPTPVDADGLPNSHMRRAHAARVRREAEFVERDGTRRGLTVVRWNRILGEALTKFRRAGLGRKLIPDRVHPSAVGHVLMAVEVLRTLGVDLKESTVTATLTAEGLQVEGSGLRTTTVPWDGRSKVTIDLTGLAPPVPLALEFEKGMPVPAEATRLSQLGFKVTGLGPGKRYKLDLDGEALGSFSGRTLAAGVDLMAGARARAAPKRYAKPVDASCRATSGNPFLRDYYCLWDLCQAKDRISIALRSDEIRKLPDHVPGFLERYRALMTEWLTAATQAIAAKREESQRAGHRLTLVAEP